MPFNSGPYFVLILAVFFAGWKLAPRRSARLWLLLGAGLLFYAASDWRFLLLLLGFTAVNFLLNLQIDSASGRGRKVWCGAAVVFSLSVLALFKYLDFFAASLNSALRLAGSEAAAPVFGWALPLGVSFYTFSSIAYTVDVYRGKVPAARSLRDFALFLAFFPKLASGPIARPGQLMPQFEAPAPYDESRVMSGFFLILYGLGKKVMVADVLAALVVNPAYQDPAGLSLPQAWLVMWAYTIQIFCDFSGYTDMAIGSGRVLGFELPENFDRPYLSKNPQEFWRRWHITLSFWLRDYLYISLGGSRRGRGRTYLALFLTMLLGGLWHGAAWTFVIWGAYHGLLLAAHRLYQEVIAVRDDESRWRDAAAIALTFNLVGVGWIFFRSPDLVTALTVISRLFAGGWAAPSIEAGALIALIAGVVLHNSLRLRDLLDRAFVRLHPVLQGSVALLFIALVDLFTSVSQPFIYNRF